MQTNSERLGSHDGESLLTVHGDVVSLKRFALHDGPGIRTTVFLKGCPLSCTWCHNPECRDPGPKIWFNPELCIRCFACRDICELTAGGERHERAITVPFECQGCGSCLVACPTKARQRIAETYSAGELLEELLRDRPFYEQSGGGITWSGGEPTAQPEFLLSCLKLCRAQGLHTTLDTCGHTSQQQLIQLLPFVDLVLFDIKLIDEERHRQHTGVTNVVILDNLRMLDATGIEIWVRVPLIPGVNDSQTDFDEIGSFVASLENTKRLDLLPYHRMGSSKEQRMAQTDPRLVFELPVREKVEEAAGVLSRHGLNVRIGG